MANTNRDVINSAMGGSQDPNQDDYQSAMGGVQSGGGGAPVDAILNSSGNNVLNSTGGYVTRSYT
jgi:hypothetical protein